jgi:hypothetical protein
VSHVTLREPCLRLKLRQLYTTYISAHYTGMATVHPSRMRMVPQSRPPPPPPPRRSPTPPLRSREEELKLKLLAKRKQQQPESSGLKIKGSSKQDVEDEPLPDIYRERGSAEPGPSRDRSSVMHGWDDRDGDDYRRRSRSRSRQDDRYPRRRSGSRSREDDTYPPRRRSESRDRPPRHDDRYRPRSRSRDRRPPSHRDNREYIRNDRPPPPHLPPFPPKWDQNLPPPIAPPIRLGFGGPGPAGLIPGPGQGQGPGQGYQPGPGPRGHGGNGFRQGGAVDFEKLVLSFTCWTGTDVRRRLERENNPLSIWPPSPKSPYRDEE